MLHEPKEMLALKNKDHCLGLQVSSGRTYYMFSERADLANEWLAYLRAAIATANGSSGSHRSGQQSASQLPASAAAAATAGSLAVPTGTGLLRAEDLSPLTSRRAMAASPVAFPALEMSTPPVVVSLTHDFHARRGSKPARSLEAQDQDKMAERVYKLLYKDR